MAANAGEGRVWSGVSSCFDGVHLWSSKAELAVGCLQHGYLSKHRNRITPLLAPQSLPGAQGGSS